MEDSEVEFSNLDMLSSPNMGEVPSSCSMDTFFDELLKDTHACTHTHTCNPPGPDYSKHTHTCYHVHTKLVPVPTDEKVSTDDMAESTENKPRKQPAGNREAVKKYREKKKARTASLEEEVMRLRAVNQQLLKRLQGEAVLEAEVTRLKYLLVDIRARIEGEIGSFPYQKPVNYPATYVMNPCNMETNNHVYCRHNGVGGDGSLVNGQTFHGCEFQQLTCPLDAHPMCRVGNVAPHTSYCDTKK